LNAVNGFQPPTFEEAVFGECASDCRELQRSRKEAVKGIDIDDLVAEIEADPEMQAGLEDARRELAHDVYGDEATLASLRLRAGLSQTRLARLLGTSQAQISRMESGGDLQASTMLRLSNVLHVPLETIAKAVTAKLKE
jgi:DNA-binding transcriptional regulator YiaG